MNWNPFNPGLDTLLFYILPASSPILTGLPNFLIEVAGPGLVVSLFIYIYRGSITLRSGELGDYIICITPYIS